MSLISVHHLSFSYEGSYDPIFEDVSFSVDTDWKLGFIGRNGRGKTTFLRLLQGRYTYQGEIAASVGFEYFPFQVCDTGETALYTVREMIAPFAQLEKEMEASLAREEWQAYAVSLEAYQAADGYTIDALITKEASRLGVDPAVLARAYASLSGGERVKLQIAALFLKKNRFLLIDEPTNHLDTAGREVMADYLSSKKGFILVSHDRTFLDRSVDHILSINRRTIEVQRGNYSSWKENKDRQEQFERGENERLKKDISRLRTAARQKADWSDKLEKTKIGSHSYDRGAVGAQAARVMKRAKTMETRTNKALEEKEALLRDVELSGSLILRALPYPKECLAQVEELCVNYGDKPLCPVSFTVKRGDRVVLSGPNGCGKSSVLRLFCGETVPYGGELMLGSGLMVSYVPQETAHLCGGLRDYAVHAGVDEALFKTILRKLGFEREQFEKEMQHFSAGQKKKVLIAASLSQKAHLCVWDEPLNYIDLPSRLQIEEMLDSSDATLLIVEHDAAFVHHIATQTVFMRKIP